MDLKTFGIRGSGPVVRLAWLSTGKQIERVEDGNGFPYYIVSALWTCMAESGPAGSFYKLLYSI